MNRERPIRVGLVVRWERSVRQTRKPDFIDWASNRFRFHEAMLKLCLLDKAFVFNEAGHENCSGCCRDFGGGNLISFLRRFLWGISSPFVMELS